MNQMSRFRGDYYKRTTLQYISGMQCMKDYLFRIRFVFSKIVVPLSPFGRSMANFWLLCSCDQLTGISTGRNFFVLVFIENENTCFRPPYIPQHHTTVLSEIQNQWFKATIVYFCSTTLGCNTEFIRFAMSARKRELRKRLSILLYANAIRDPLER